MRKNELISEKIEIINSTETRPYLILYKNDIYPSVKFNLKGKFKEYKSKSKRTYYIDDGVLFFLDISGKSHYITFHGNDDYFKLSKDEMWEKRIQSLDEISIRSGKEPEQDPEKRIAPWKKERLNEENIID